MNTWNDFFFAFRLLLFLVHGCNQHVANGVLARSKLTLKKEKKSEKREGKKNREKKKKKKKKNPGGLSSLFSELEVLLELVCETLESHRLSVGSNNDFFDLATQLFVSGRLHVSSKSVAKQTKQQTASE